MGNTTACMRQSKEWDSSESSTMVEPEHLPSCAIATSEHAPTSSSPAFVLTRSESMREMMESGKGTSTEEQIERSKSHWSQVVQLDSSRNEDEEEVDEIADNMDVFKALQMHPTWGTFFITFDEGDCISLVVREKFAEGGQAELYEAQVTWRNPEANERDLKYGTEWVLKVFKKGNLL